MSENNNGLESKIGKLNLIVLNMENIVFRFWIFE